MSKKKTHEEFIAELKKVNTNIEIIGKYRTTNDKIHCKCNIHNYEWNGLPFHLLKGHGCLMCGREISGEKRKISFEEYNNKMHKSNPNISVIGKFVNMSTKILVKCNIDNHEWEVMPSTLLSFGCPKCAGNAPKSTDEFRNELDTYAPNLELLSDYEKSNRKVHIRCLDCGNDDWITPNKLQGGQNCKFCHESKGEKKIRRFLEDNKIVFDSQKVFDDLVGIGDRKLSYDFFIKDKGILIEYQGEQHEKPINFSGNMTDVELCDRFERQLEHDKRKRQYSNDNGFTLVEIWYYDANNIEKILSEILNKHELNIA